MLPVILREYNTTHCFIMDVAWCASIPAALVCGFKYIGFHVWSKCIWFWVQLTVTTKRSIFLERVAQPRTSTNNCSLNLIQSDSYINSCILHTPLIPINHVHILSISQFYPFSLLPSPYRFTPSESLVLFGSQNFSRALKKWAVAAKLLLMISSGIENYQKKLRVAF